MGVSAVAFAIAETAFEMGGTRRRSEAPSPHLPYGPPPLQIQLAAGDQVLTGKTLNEKDHIITAGIAGTKKSGNPGREVKLHRQLDLPLCAYDISRAGSRRKHCRR